MSSSNRSTDFSSSSAFPSSSLSTTTTTTTSLTNNIVSTLPFRDQWTCQRCTFDNIGGIACEMCETPKEEVLIPVSSTVPPIALSSSLSSTTIVRGKHHHSTSGSSTNPSSSSSPPSLLLPRNSEVAPIDVHQLEASLLPVKRDTSSTFSSLPSSNRLPSSLSLVMPVITRNDTSTINNHNSNDKPVISVTELEQGLYHSSSSSSFSPLSSLPYTSVAGRTVPSSSTTPSPLATPPRPPTRPTISVHELEELVFRQALHMLENDNDNDYDSDDDLENNRAILESISLQALEELYTNKEEQYERSSGNTNSNQSFQQSIPSSSAYISRQPYPSSTTTTVSNSTRPPVPPLPLNPTLTKTSLASSTIFPPLPTSPTNVSPTSTVTTDATSSTPSGTPTATTTSIFTPVNYRKYLDQLLMIYHTLTEPAAIEDIFLHQWTKAKLLGKDATSLSPRNSKSSSHPNNESDAEHKLHMVQVLTALQLFELYEDDATRAHTYSYLGEEYPEQVTITLNSFNFNDAQRLWEMYRKKKEESKDNDFKITKEVRKSTNVPKTATKPANTASSSSRPVYVPLDTVKLANTTTVSNTPVTSFSETVRSISESIPPSYTSSATGFSNRRFNSNPNLLHPLPQQQYQRSRSNSQNNRSHSHSPVPFETDSQSEPMSNKANEIFAETLCICGKSTNMDTRNNVSHTAECYQHCAEEARYSMAELHTYRKELYEKASATYKKKSNGNHGVFRAAAGYYADQARDIKLKIKAASTVASYATFLANNLKRTAGRNPPFSSDRNNGNYNGNNRYNEEGNNSTVNINDASQFPSLPTPAALLNFFASSNNGRIEIDLHGQRIDEARHLLQSQILPQIIDNRTTVVQLITGKGNNSKNGVSPLKHDVELFLRMVVGTVLYGNGSGSGFLHSYKILDGGGGYELRFRYP